MGHLEVDPLTKTTLLPSSMLTLCVPRFGTVPSSSRPMAYVIECKPLVLRVTWLIAGTLCKTWLLPVVLWYLYLEKNTAIYGALPRNPHETTKPPSLARPLEGG